jgi:SnoaL-like domain
VAGDGIAPVDVARRFARALDEGDDEAAAELLADDAELVYPGETVRGRAAWKQGRAAQERPSGLSEHVEGATFIESGSAVEMTARLIQRWMESGDVANEHPILVRFEVVDAAIQRLEFLPLPPGAA